MDAGAVLELTWRDDETADAVIDAMASTGQIRIVLPASYNHALFRELNPAAEVSAMEQLDVSGGADVLSAMARVDGLSALARLVEPVRESGALVVLSSPPVLVISQVSRTADC